MAIRSSFSRFINTEPSMSFSAQHKRRSLKKTQEIGSVPLPPLHGSVQLTITQNIVLQYGAAWCSVLQHTAVCCSVLQCVALLNPRSLYLNKTKGCPEIVSYPHALTIVLQCVAGCCTSVGGAHNLRGTPLTGHTTYNYHLQTPLTNTKTCVHGSMHAWMLGDRSDAWSCIGCVHGPLYLRHPTTRPHTSEKTRRQAGAET